METITRSAKLIGSLVSLIILIMLVISFNDRIAEQRELSVEKERVSAKLEALKLTDANLEAQIAYATSDAAVEEWAYQEARQKRPGDQLVVPVPGAEQAPSAVWLAEETVQIVEVENWEVWWALFFDRDLLAAQ